MLPATTERVSRNTDAQINEAIRRKTAECISRVTAGGHRAIQERIYELDHEWDVERTLEANAATVSLVGIGLAAFVDRRFLILPAAVAGFLLQHAVQGWCPPLPVLRRLGLRTQTEIEEERHALKALRGDYDLIKRDDRPNDHVSAAFHAAQLV
jgi:hypothetical protein